MDFRSHSHRSRISSNSRGILLFKLIFQVEREQQLLDLEKQQGGPTFGQPQMGMSPAIQ